MYPDDAENVAPDPEASDGESSSASSDSDAAYLRSTRRRAEENRYRRGLPRHSGSPARAFWGKGRGVVQGGIPSTQLGDASGSRGNPKALREGFEAGATAALAAAMATMGRGPPEPSPSAKERAEFAATEARLREANRHLRRELGVAQRLMTGYHAQLMTGGRGPAALIQQRSFHEEDAEERSLNGQLAAPSYANRRVRAPFSFSFANRGGAALSTGRRADAKRVAAELETLRVERAFAEAAAEEDLRGVARLESDVAELKAIVGGLVRGGGGGGGRGRLSPRKPRREEKKEEEEESARRRGATTAQGGRRRRGRGLRRDVRGVGDGPGGRRGGGDGGDF